MPKYVHILKMLDYNSSFMIITQDCNESIFVTIFDPIFTDEPHPVWPDGGKLEYGRSPHVKLDSEDNKSALTHSARLNFLEADMVERLVVDDALREEARDDDDVREQVERVAGEREAE